MAVYQYKALDKSGQQRKGTINAENEIRAAEIVREQGLTPLEVKPQNIFNKDINLFGASAPKVAELAMFCSQFASLLRVGINITDTLEMLVDTVKNKALVNAVKGTRVSVQKGDSLAQSMSRYPLCFDSMMIHMIEAGEASGSLDTTFERLAEQKTKSAKIAASVKSALVYPIIVLIVAIIAVIVLLILVVPSFTAMFKDLDMDMPKITLGVMALSDFVKSNILLIILILGVIIFGIKILTKSETVRQFFALLAVKTPLIKNFTEKNQSTKFARTLSTLQAAGLTLTNALEITAGVMTNLKFEAAVRNAREKVMMGLPLSQALKQENIFPAMLINMVAIGEDSGDMTGMLDKTADYYDEQLQTTVDSLMAAMNPAMIILLLVVVGPVLAAVLAPMLTLYTGLDTAL